MPDRKQYSRNSRSQNSRSSSSRGDVRKVLRPGPTGHHPGILPASGEKSTDTIMWIETFTAAGAPPLKAAENPPEKKGETAIWA